MITRLAILVLAVSYGTISADPGSPREQMQAGVAPGDVKCAEGLDLVIMRSGSAACVRPDTAQRMLERGIILEHIGPTQSPRDPAPAAAPAVRAVPASGIIDFYITDSDLDTERAGIDRIPTAGLVEFAINGVPVGGPDIMTETGPGTGVFLARLDTSEIGRPLAAGDVITATYLDMSDYTGSRRSTTESVVVYGAFARLEADGGNRIGREFTVRLYEPDANLDSRDEDTIPLSSIRFRTEGKIEATLAHPALGARSPYLVETGRDTGVFEVIMEIPRQVDGDTIHIGHWYEMTYVDASNPAKVPEEVTYRGVIGTPRPQ